MTGHYFRVWIPDAQAAELRTLARDAGLTVSSYVRHMIFQALRERERQARVERHLRPVS